MSLRRIVQQMLVTDSALIDLVGGRVIGSTGLDGEGDLAAGVARPFLTWRLSGTYPGSSRRVSTLGLEVWAHQEPGSYLLVDKILKEVTRLFDGAIQVTDEDPEYRGMAWLMEATYQQHSPDLYDDIRRTNTRSVSYVLAGSGDI